MSKENQIRNEYEDFYYCVYIPYSWIGIEDHIGYKVDYKKTHDYNVDALYHYLKTNEDKIDGWITIAHCERIL